MDFHEKIDLGEKIGSIEVDYYSGEGFYLELFDTSSPGNHSGCVALTPAKAREIAKALRRAAELAES